jgi:polyribonucleotide nucleotidyltransferase
MGRVVNITKFGAFVNILPGRDGLVHISKLGGGKRINAVEDVLELGQEFEVRVEEIDDKGKVSLTPAGDPPPLKEGAGESSNSGGGDRAPRRERSERAPRQESAPAGAATDVVEVSFEDSFDAQLADELGDLGPKSERPQSDDGGRRGNGGGRRRHR